jgi:hypothetical protein
MFSVGSKYYWPINKCLSNYIKISTDKSIKDYMHSYNITDTDIKNMEDNNGKTPENFISLLIFISGVSFLAGYKIGKLIK